MRKYSKYDNTKNDNNISKSSSCKPQMQFSKLMCIRSWWLMTVSVAVCLGGEFFLQYTSRGSMREIVTVVLSLISFVTIFINGGYITQNIFRDTSLNKHKIDIDEDGTRHHISSSYDTQNTNSEI